ncbi:hypothetical protein KQ51_01248 [Candidatus Izimaplasma bacterium HR1]|jgi:trichohyalin|uniref:hypothetical protein n=1 Tax=Candidatus Izimoplasma sp. HR1 TaxID=1541959 RepID=UPI0004F6B548|nr:hypothetical protein KQ51_01248 [Candidatus Izimaplasma bacterium HR1]
MAKLFKSSLPKVISKANREISTIIENDIAKESEILKNLVDQVLAANLEVKKKNNQRITDTKRKLQELDLEIDDLNKSIDLVDRETVIEQLNEMIDAENKIFTARQEIRFFENENTPQKLKNLTSIYTQLATSVDKTRNVEESYKNILHDSNSLLFDKEIETTNQVIKLMEELYDSKHQFVKDSIANMGELKQQIFETETQFNEYIKENIESSRLLQEKSTTTFTREDNAIELGEKITTNHKQTLETIQSKIELINLKFEQKQDDIIANYKKYENSTREKLEAKNVEKIASEKKLVKERTDELKNIRLLIIDAEKKQEFGKMQNLMKKFDKLEKSKISKVSDRTDKLLTAQTKKTKLKTILQLENLELKRTSDINKQELNLKLEDVKFEEAKILYKIKSDYDGLHSDISINKEKMQNVTNLLNEQERVTKELYKLKNNLRVAELELMKQNELSDNTLFDQFRELLKGLKEIEHKRILILQENVSNHEIIRVEQQFQINKTVHDLQLEKELSDIDKLILKKRNESLIRIEKIKEDANSEVIYQESLIKIAQKEHELQIIKVQSLYENERALAEEQVERINLGVQVNDAFVKTTLENQLLFASQQIRCSESEYDIRIESIALTKDQELAYANKKIDYYKQKYEYEKSKIKKELDDKLEDLNYKLLLFTDKEDNTKIQAQIDELTTRYGAMIDEIEHRENQDEEIKRYEKVIAAAEERAMQAANEALALKEQTTTAFEALYHQTKEKYELIEQTSHSEDTVGIMPLLNSSAISSADERLQRAIKEADELYNERISEPNKTINLTKQKLLELTKDEATEIFCNEQKVIKKQKISNHQVELEKLVSATKIAVANANAEIARLKENVKNRLEQDSSTQFDANLYRDEVKIDSDYKVLVQKEQLFANERIKEVTSFKQTRITEQKRVFKDTNLWIKQALKPYRKYIRYASRGLNAEKRELTRKNKRILKKALAVASDNFEIEL